MFDLNTPSALFFQIGKTLEDYYCNKSKKVSDLFFLIMTLNHLREWIAPNYKGKWNNKEEVYIWPKADTPEKRFSREIFESDSFDTLRNICNGTKHLSLKKHKTKTSYGLSLEDWGKVKDVKVFSDGPPSGFYVDDTEIEILLKKIYKYYNNYWFAKYSDPEANKL